MTTSLTTFDCSSFTTDAKFRAWGTAINAALTASGLTNTTDTGQVNWTTVTKATTTNTNQGYEIWRFNDTLQSTRPIFFRVDYGSAGTASGNSPCVSITLGTGSNGAGTITGVGSGGIVAGTNDSNTSTNTVQKIGASYSASAGSMCLIADFFNVAGSPSGIFAISRTCDSSGNPTGDGVYMIRSRNAAMIKYTANYNTSTNQQAGSAGATAGYLSTTSQSGGNTIALLRNYALIPNPYGVNGVISYLGTDIPAWTTFTASPFGSSHTYLALGTSSGGAATWNATSTFACAFIWE